MNRLQTIHLVIGVVSVLAFFYTGLYMRMNFPALYQPDETLRYLFRANHIYLLDSALLNCGLGIYVSYREITWKRNLQTAGSLLILITPFVLTLAFFTEASDVSPNRPITALGIFSLFIGTVLHIIGGYKKSGLSCS
jgi:hypothetical protein